MPAGLNQDRPDSESDHGCDAAVLQIDRDKQTIEFASAKLGLFQVNFKASAEEITAAMKSEFAAWQGTNAKRDDVTAVVFRL